MTRQWELYLGQFLPALRHSVKCYQRLHYADTTLDTPQSLLGRPCFIASTLLE